MDKSQEIAVFKVKNILCGLEITQVQEINKHINITKVYGAPDYVRGIMNLRGRIVTVIDMRTKFGLEALDINEDMRIVVVRSGDESIGLLVDSVDDVIEADVDDVEAPPSNVKGVSSEFFEGVLKLENNLLMILDTNKIIAVN